MIGQHVVYAFSPGTNLLNELAGYKVGQEMLNQCSINGHSMVIQWSLGVSNTGQDIVSIAAGSLLLEKTSHHQRL